MTSRTFTVTIYATDSREDPEVEALTPDDVATALLRGFPRQAVSVERTLPDGTRERTWRKLVRIVVD